MIARGDFGHRLVGNLFAFAEDFHFAARLEQQRAFGANDQGAVGAFPQGGQAERGPRGVEAVVVVMHHKLVAREAAAAGVGDGALVVGGVAVVGGAVGVGLHRFG